MTQKTIFKIIPSQLVNMGGIILHQPLPAQEVDYIDPFILIHHARKEMDAGKTQEQTGIGAHPHRGFSPVTFIFEGDVHHKDSQGNSEIVKAGGTQWMFAGNGIIHAERSSKEFAKSGGIAEIIQFWVNAPAKHKMDEPYYKPISKEDTPTLNHDKVTIQVVCGTYENLKGAVDYMISLLLLRYEMKKGGQHQLKVEQSHNTIIYLLDGKLEINGQSVEKKDLIWFNKDGNEIEIFAQENTRFVVFSGEPIDEPVKAHGPFVMNLQAEIWRAMSDYEAGHMGKLIETFD